MTTGASIGWKSQFWLDAAGGTLTQIMGVTSIQPPTVETGEAETTDLEATNRFRTFIPTLKDPGTITVTLNYVGNSATDILIRAAAADLVERDWEVVYSDVDGTIERQIAGKGYVSSISEPEITVDGIKSYSFTVRVSGAITESAAA